MTNQTPESAIDDSMVEAAYRAFCEARIGKALSDDEHDALRSRLELTWIKPTIVAALRAANMLREPGVPDAATAAIGRVRALHVPDEYGLCVECSWEYPETSYDAIGNEVEWPCPTVAALDGAPEPEGKRWFAACWRDDNGILNSLESSTVLREHAEADVKRWRDREQREFNGQPDRVVLATKVSYPWLPVEGESK